jgi:signal peptidase I
MNETATRLRRPLYAALLSLGCTGLGHVYCGRIVRGATLLVLSLLLGPVIAILMQLPASGTTPLLIWASICMIPLISLFAVIDSIVIAARAGSDYVLRDYNRPILYVLLLVVGLVFPTGSMLYLRRNIAQAFSIPTESMVPTVMRGDRILVDKLWPAGGTPHRFDVVVFRCPTNRDRNYIKRVIGLPGDRISIVDGEVILNGTKLIIESEGEGIRTEGNAERRYRIQVGPGDQPDLPEEEVPPASCFVLGDHRTNCEDSRHFGFVPLGDIIGTARYRFWPIFRAGTID